MEKKLCGIYGIFSEDRSKVYIGQSVDFAKRVIKHRHSLKTNKHHCNFLQNYYNKYGLKSISFEILDICPVEDLNKKETELWQNYKKQGFELFNPMPENGALRGQNNGFYPVSRTNLKTGEIEFYG